MKQFKNVILEKKDGIAWVTINRPERLNATDLNTRKELAEALEDCEQDESVRVVVIQGAGDKAFCAGADLKEFYEIRDPLMARECIKWGQNYRNIIARMEKPVIAAVKGYALAGGFETALVCDITIASEDAKFSLPEINVGLFPAGGGTQRLIYNIGLKRAKELLFTGEMIDAQTALKLGIVNKVVPREKFDDEVKAFAEKLKEKPAKILGLLKYVVNKPFEDLIASGMETEMNLFALCFATEDKEEGIKAFLEKRRPKFKGK